VAGRKTLFSHSRNFSCFLFYLWFNYHKIHGPYAQPRGPQAARLRQRKAQLLHRFPIPAELLTINAQLVVLARRRPLP